MKQGKSAGTLELRIRSGSIQKKDILRRLGELAFGRANDCVKLVMEENPNLEELDLSLLSEVKRNDKGTVEVRLIDRLRAVDMLSAAMGGQEGEMEAFLQALRGGETP